MDFTPNRELLNVNFDGYKLAGKSLPCICQKFEGGVRIASAHDDQFSYQHLRYFTTHNHLISDPWNGSSVYWCGNNGAILCGSMGPSGELQISTVFTPSYTPNHAMSVNGSLLFLTDHLCLFTTGSGPLLLLATTDRSRSINQPPSWTVLADVTPQSLKDTPFIIQCTHLSSTGLSLDVGLLELKCAAGFIHSIRMADKPSICVFHLYRVTLTQSLLSFSIVENVDVGVASVTLSYSFESTTMPLYTEFIEGKVLVLSESTPRLFSTAQNTMDELSKEGEGEGGDNCNGDEKEDDDAYSSAAHPGIGYKVSSQTFDWTQSDTDLTVSVSVPCDVTKRDISCVVEPNNLVIGLTDGTTFVRGNLFSRVDCEASLWTLEANRLEVTLEKAEPGLHWPILVLQQGQTIYSQTNLPLKEGLEGLTMEEIDKLQQQVDRLCDTHQDCDISKESGDAPSSPKRRCRPIMQNTLEDCDTLIDDDVSVFILAEDGSTSQRVGLGGRQLLFTLSSPFSSSLLCICHDIDALLYCPKIEGEALQWTHFGTFNALGYVQASKREKKFLTASSDLSFAVLCDCSRHVFVYQQPRDGVRGATALQYVHTIAMKSDRHGILGVHASARGLVFVLCDSELLVLINVTNIN